jgi:FKBP-type peptidyl-prolyl cis-trans isomerase
MRKSLFWLAVMLLITAVVMAADSTVVDSTKIDVKAAQELQGQVIKATGDSAKTDVKATQELQGQVMKATGDSAKTEVKATQELQGQVKKVTGDSAKTEVKTKPETPGQVKKETGQKGAEAVKAAEQKGTENKMVTTASGLKTVDQVVGTGVEAVKGDQVEVHYTGWLWENGKKGNKFDSSLDHGKPFAFNLGAGQVIKGWDEGVAGMKVGGKRELIIPPALAYGQRAVGGVIPPNSTLMFEVELLKVTKGK